MESNLQFWKYLTWKKKYRLNFITCGFEKLIFDPLETPIGHNFRFMCYFCTVIRNKGFDIYRGIFTLLFWKSNFFTPFCTIASFYKISQRAKTRSQGKNLWVFWLQNEKLNTLKNFFKSRNFNNFSRFEVQYLRNRPILRILYTNCCKFYSLSVSKKE